MEFTGYHNTRTKQSDWKFIFVVAVQNARIITSQCDSNFSHLQKTCDVILLKVSKAAI